MQKRGRPPSSAIRQNLIEILYFMKKGYGYDIYRHYIAIFPKVTLRSIYYHLSKGVELGEFEIENVEQEQGDYSWGKIAEKTYYRLGKGANPKLNPLVKKHFENGIH